MSIKKCLIVFGLLILVAVIYFTFCESKQIEKAENPTECNESLLKPFSGETDIKSIEYMPEVIEGQEDGIEEVTEAVLEEEVEVIEEAEVVEKLPEQFETQVKEIEKPQNICLGKCRLTAYCSCRECCGKYAENRPKDENGNEIVITSSGARAKQGVTVAVDKSQIPFGTVLIINGKEYIAQDEGYGVGNNCIDIYFNNHDEATRFGIQYADVYIKVEG